MRQSAARPAWMIAALLVAGQVPAAAGATTAGSQAPNPAMSCARPGCGASFRVAAAPEDQATEPSAAPPAPRTPDVAPGTGGEAAPRAPDSRDDAGAAPTPSVPADPGAASPPAPRMPGRRRADAPIGHFRVFEHPSCAADPCRATVSDLDSRRSFEATVSLGPMHLAPQLDGFARSGQIDLLLSGELHGGPKGPTLRALHLEGVTPHTPAPPAKSRAGHARTAPGPARSHPPAAPEPRLLRA